MTVVNQSVVPTAAMEEFVSGQMYVLVSQGILEQGASKVYSVSDTL